MYLYRGRRWRVIEIAHGNRSRKGRLLRVLPDAEAVTGICASRIARRPPIRENFRERSSCCKSPKQ